MGEIICKHFEQACNSKACKYYKPTDKPKVGLCNLKMKLAFICLYSEKALGNYTSDTPIVRAEELN
jgi:hypothetical protein